MQQMEEKVVFSATHQDWRDRLANSIQQILNGWFTGSDTGRTTKDVLNGVWLAHPMHPMVTDVPVGAWTTAAALDLAEAATGADMEPATTTAIGIGIAGAVASAASGLADWSDTEDDQRRVGIVHATTNVIGVVFYLMSFFNRIAGHRSTARTFSWAGFITLLVGAWLGGELAYRLGTQVSRNAWVKGPKGFTRVANESELMEDRPKRVEVMGVAVMLVRHQGEIYALNDVCNHAGCSLSNGRIEDGAIECACHGSTYMLSDGAVVHGPAASAQPHYEVHVENGTIQVRTSLR